MQRPNRAAVDPTKAPPVDGPCDLAGYPSIIAFLADPVWEDGKPRETGTILLLTQDGVWKAWVNDKAGKVSAFVSAASLRDLLDVVNDGIELDQLDWRRDRPRPQGRGR